MYPGKMFAFWQGPLKAVSLIKHFHVTSIVGSLRTLGDANKLAKIHSVLTMCQARHCTKYFTGITSFNPCNSMKYTLLVYH